MAMNELLRAALASPVTPPRQSRTRRMLSEMEGDSSSGPPSSAPTPTLKRPRRGSWTTSVLESRAALGAPDTEHQLDGLRDAVREAKAAERRGSVKTALDAYRIILLMAPAESELLTKIAGLEAQLAGRCSGGPTACRCDGANAPSSQNGGGGSSGWRQGDLNPAEDDGDSSEAPAPLSRCPSDLVVRKLARAAVKRQHINKLGSGAKEEVAASILVFVNEGDVDALAERLGARLARAIIDCRPFRELEELSHLGLYHTQLIRLAKQSALEQADLLC